MIDEGPRRLIIPNDTPSVLISTHRERARERGERKTREGGKEREEGGR